MAVALSCMIASVTYALEAMNTNPRSPPFPRSEYMQDIIMLRRFEARRQIKQAHRIRVALWTICIPIGVCALIKIWSLSIELVLR